MRSFICILAAVLTLVGVGFYTMAPVNAGEGGGQAVTTDQEGKAIPFKPGSEPAKGFEDIQWGDHVRTFTNLTLSACGVYDIPELCLYRIEDAVEGPEKIKIRLLFWRDRLFGMELETQGRKNWAPFRSMVFEEFGGPTVPASGNEFQWEGEKALAQLYYSYRSRKSSLLIVSVKIGDEMGHAEELKTW